MWNDGKLRLVGAATKTRKSFVNFDVEFLMPEGKIQIF